MSEYVYLDFSPEPTWAECELKVSAFCTGKSIQYSGLADKNCCEPCQQKFMRDHWSTRKGEKPKLLAPIRGMIPGRTE